ncbi:MAG: DUF1573 domain-containing protein [Planctomycetota bacterium]
MRAITGTAAHVPRSALAALLALVASCGDGSDPTPPDDAEIARIAQEISGLDRGAPVVVTPDFGDFAELPEKEGADLRTNAVLSLVRTELPVPPALPGARELERTEDGLLEFERGARTYKAGRFVEGEPINSTRRIRNGSRRSVRITRLEGSCHCVDVACFRLRGDERGAQFFPGDSVAPGEELEVQVQLDTTGRSGPLQLDGIVDYVGATRPLKFTIVTNVQPIFTVEPPLGLQVQDAVLGSRAQGRARITTPLAERFRAVIDDSSLPRHVRLVSRPVDPDADGFAKSYDVRVEILGTAPRVLTLQLYHVPIEITTADEPDGGGSHTWIRSLELGYATQLPVGIAMVQPDGSQRALASVFLPATPAGERVVRRYRFVHRDDWVPQGPFTVTLEDGAKIGPQDLPPLWLTWRVEAQEDGARDLVVDFEPSADGPTGPVRGAFVVELGHPSLPELRLPFSALVR